VVGDGGVRESCDDDKEGVATDIVGVLDEDLDAVALALSILEAAGDLIGRVRRSPLI